MEDYKEKYHALLAEKEKIEAEFGQKRAQFRQIYLDCENKLKDQTETVRQKDVEITGLLAQLETSHADAEGYRTAAQLSVETQQDELNALRAKHQEEIASLQHIWEETSRKRHAAFVKHHEEERNKLVEELRHQRAGSEDKEGLMSLMSNAFSRKASSIDNKQPPQQIQTDNDSAKSVIAQLEKENASLKKQLHEHSQKQEADKKESVESSSTMSQKAITPTSAESKKDTQKLSDTHKYLEAERSARGDLEMYVAVLNTQKGVLQEDADKLRRELHNVCRMLEQEKSNHKELKQTWTMANEQFISTHTLMQDEITRMRKIMSPQQLEQLSREIRKNRSAKPIKTEAEHPYQVSGGTVTSEGKSIKSKKSDAELIDFDRINRDSPRAQRKHQLNKQSFSNRIFDSLFPAARELDELLKESSPLVNEKPLLLSSSSESDEDIEQAIRKQNMHKHQGVDEVAEEEMGFDNPRTLVEDLVSIQSADTTSITSSHTVGDPQGSITGAPSAAGEDTQIKKSSSHGDILNLNSPSEEHPMEKSLSQGDMSRVTSQAQRQQSPSPVKKLSELFDSKMLIEETDWSNSTTQEFSHPCMMCQNYEKQLQRLQKEVQNHQDKERKLQTLLENKQTELSGEQEKFATLEKSIESACKDSNSQLNVYKNNQLEVDKQVQLLHSQFQQFQSDIVEEIKTLSEERDRVLAESLDKDKTDAMDTSDEELKSEVMFLKDRLMAEQFDRESTERILQEDLRIAKEQLASLMSKPTPTQEPPEDLLS